MATYLMIFYTDNVGIAAAGVGTLFLVARFWDAVTDPMIGVIVDRFRSKWGRFRPFILVGGTITGIMTILCFINPNVGIQGKFIYACITYIVWNTTYGLFDVPYWSMSAALSEDPNERTKIISVPKLMGVVGALLVGVLTIPMVTAFGQGNNSKGYFFTALILGLICIIGVIFTFAKTRERVDVPVKKKEKFLKSIQVITKNGPLLIVLLSTLFTYMAMLVKQTIQTYYFTYIYNNVGLVSLFSLTGMVPLILAIIFAAPLSKKMGKKKAAILVVMVSAVFSGAMFFCTQAPVLLFIFNAISMAGLGGMLVLSMSMQADTVEYAEWKIGKRSESIIFSMGTFTTKLASALSGAIVGYWLSMVGYVPNATQSAEVLGGINIMMSWLPAAGMFIMGVILMFYKLTEERHAQIVEEIEKRKTTS